MSKFQNSILIILTACFFLPPSFHAQDTSHGWIVISAGEYGALRAKAFPVEREAELPQVEATLMRVEYDLEILDQLAAGRAILTIDVLKDGWVRVPIPGGLLIREARLDGRLVSL